MGFFGVCSGGAECSHLNAMVTNAASKPSVCFISLWRGDSRETRLSSVLGAASRWEGFGWMPVGATRRQGSDGLDFGRRLECFPGSQHLRWCSLRIAVAFFFFFFPGSIVLVTQGLSAPRRVGWSLATGYLVA